MCMCRVREEETERKGGGTCTLSHGIYRCVSVGGVSA